LRAVAARDAVGERGHARKHRCTAAAERDKARRDEAIKKK
jgi:hypothetical protein